MLHTEAQGKYCNRFSYCSRTSCCYRGVDFDLNASSASSKVERAGSKKGANNVSARFNRVAYSATVFYNSNLVTSNLKTDNPDFREDNYMRIKNSEKCHHSRVLGLSIVKYIGRHFGIESGIGLQTVTTEINAKPLVARRDADGKFNYRISTSSGYAYYKVNNRPNPAPADSIRTLTPNSALRYVSIPLGIQYRFHMRSFNLVPSVMPSANYLRSATITNVQSLEHTYSGELQGLKPTYFDGILRTSVDFYITKQLGLSIVPTYRFALSDATEIRPEVARRNSVGVALGIQLNF